MIRVLILVMINLFFVWISMFHMFMNFHSWDHLCGNTIEGAEILLSDSLQRDT